MTPTAPASASWAAALCATLALAALAVAPPVIGGAAGDVVHHAFSVACHQMAERSPHLAGGPIALCHRCFGILTGLVVGVAAVPALAAGWRQRVASGAQAGWLVAAVVPTAVDWLLGATGVWANTPASRLLTGALFGLAAGVILGANLFVPRPFPSAPLCDAQ